MDGWQCFLSHLTADVYIYTYKMQQTFLFNAIVSRHTRTSIYKSLDAICDLSQMVRGTFNRRMIRLKVKTIQGHSSQLSQDFSD